MSRSTSELPDGRLAVVNDLVPESGRSLSVGCKDTRVADINVDIDDAVAPDLLGDARQLPFQSGSFDTVVFTDVLNIVPRDDQQRTIEELYRVLRMEGELVLTVPNDVMLYRALDVGRHVSGARTYSIDEIREMLTDSGFEVEELFTRGDVYEPIEYLWYCFVTFPLSKLWPRRTWAYAPTPLARRSQAAYQNGSGGTDGRSIFVRARKP